MANLSFIRLSHSIFYSLCR